MAVFYEDNCVGCPQGCISCGRKHQLVFECDGCGEQGSTLYEFDGEQLCAECVLDRLAIVEGSGE